MKRGSPDPTVRQTPSGSIVPSERPADKCKGHAQGTPDTEKRELARKTYKNVELQNLKKYTYLLRYYEYSLQSKARYFTWDPVRSRNTTSLASTI